jgi:hypothetical protein
MTTHMNSYRTFAPMKFFVHFLVLTWSPIFAQPLAFSVSKFVRSKTLSQKCIAAPSLEVLKQAAPVLLFKLQKDVFPSTTSILYS